MSSLQDKVMQLYLNPKIGYWSKGKMRPKVGNLLDNIYGIQRHRELKHPQKLKMFRHIEAQRPFDSVQMDLAFLPKLRSPLNRNVWGFIVVIDVFSRYLWIKTFTNRRSLHIPLLEIIQQMKLEFNQTPRNMTADNEMATTKMQQLAANFDFKWWFADPSEKFRTGISERVIRTIKNLIKRYLTQNNTTKYIDVLPDLIHNYNNTYHRTIRTTPYKSITERISFAPSDNRDVEKLEIGDQVRVLQKRNKLTKGDVPYWSEDLYEIVDTDLNRYVLKNTVTGGVLPKRYGRHQLMVVKNPVIKDKYKSNNDSLGYDAGIAQNAYRNRVNAALHKEGIEPDEELINLGGMEVDDPPDKLTSNVGEFGDDGVRVDDLSKKWDELEVSKWDRNPTNKDGSCFFNAISGFLHWEKKNEIIAPGSVQEKGMSKFLRTQIVRFMKRNLKTKIPQIGATMYDMIDGQLISENDNQTVDQYLNLMLTTNNWAGQSEIIATGMYFKRNILVYVQRGSVYEKHGGFVYDDTDNRMITLFWNQKDASVEGTHYEYLTPHPPSTNLPRRVRRHRQPPKRYIPRTSESAKDRNKLVKILPKNYQDVDGDPVSVFRDDQVGQWTRDSKTKTGWLKIVKYKGDMRYKGVYAEEKDDKFEKAPLTEYDKPQPSKKMTKLESLKMRKKAARNLRAKLRALKRKFNKQELEEWKKNNTSQLGAIIDSL